MEWTQISRVNPMTLICDLSLGSWVMCSAHRLTERNILVKCSENHPRASGDMEQNEGQNDCFAAGTVVRKIFLFSLVEGFPWRDGGNNVA